VTSEATSVWCRVCGANATAVAFGGGAVEKFAPPRRADGCQSEASTTVTRQIADPPGGAGAYADACTVSGNLNPPGRNILTGENVSGGQRIRCSAKSAWSGTSER